MIKQFRIPFSGRAHQYTDAEISLVADVMKQAEPLTQGHYLHAFEDSFKQYAHVEYAFALSNATVGLELVAQLCKFKEGDEVVIPSHTFTSSAYPFIKAGARIVWADIDLDTRVVSAKTIEPCITPKTRAVVVPHLYGYGADMPEIVALAKRSDVLVVEDAAQAMGVLIDGKMAGSFGDFGVYSFHSHKNISTLGEGGMLTLKDSNMAQIVPMLRHNGHANFLFEQTDYWIPAMGNVDLPELDCEPLWPTNCCIGEVECALGEKLIDRVDAINAQKRQRALAFIDALKEYPELIFHREQSTRHNYHLLSARLRHNYRDAFIRRMANEHQIQCVVQYYPLNRYPFYQKLGFAKASCPNADLFFDNMVSFPFHHSLTDIQIDQMLSASQETLKYLKIT